MAKKVKTPFGVFESMAAAGRHINAAGYKDTVKAAYPVGTFRLPGTMVPAPQWVSDIGMSQDEHDTIDIVRDLCNNAVGGWEFV
jgi:hypothetical protein